MVCWQCWCSTWHILTPSHTLKRTLLHTHTPEAARSTAAVERERLMLRHDSVVKEHTQRMDTEIFERMQVCVCVCVSAYGTSSPRLSTCIYIDNNFIHFYSTLHCTPLHHTTLHRTTLHHTTLYHTSLHYTTLHHTTLHQAEHKKRASSQLKLKKALDTLRTELVKAKEEGVHYKVCGVVWDSGV
jgi:hypothetical protein